MTVGIWFADVGQIQGACNGITFTGAYFGGLSITVFWDGTWQGTGGTSQPIGVNVVSSAGIEIGAGLFYNATATQFFHKRPDFPKS